MDLAVYAESSSSSSNARTVIQFSGVRKSQAAPENWVSKYATNAVKARKHATNVNDANGAKAKTQA